MSRTNPPRRGVESRRSGQRPASAALAVDQGVDLAALYHFAGVVTHLVVVSAPFSADLIDWLSRTAAEGLTSRPIRSRNAYAARPRSPPRLHHAGTCERYCRRSSAAESCRTADSAGGSRSAANTEWRSSPPACRCAVARRAGLAGSSAPAAPTPHPAGRSDSRRAPAGKSGAAPPSKSLFAITVSSVAEVQTIRRDAASFWGKL